MKKIVTIELDKKRHLKYGAMSFVTMERASGQSMGNMDFEKMESVFVMLYGGLVWEDKSLSVDKVIELVDEKIEAEIEANPELPVQEAMANVMKELSEKVGEAMGGKKETLPSK